MTPLRYASGDLVASSVPARPYRNLAAGIAHGYGVTFATAANLLGGDHRYRVLRAARILGPVRCYKSRVGWMLDGHRATPDEICNAAYRERRRLAENACGPRNKP